MLSSPSASSTTASAAQAFRVDPLADLVAGLPLDLFRHAGIEPLRLAGLALEIDLRVAELPDLVVREVEGFEKLLLADLVRTRLDHGERVGCSDDDQVELLVLLHFRERRIDD